jgi:tetratricopeptide (TPR) repeat protein
VDDVAHILCDLEKWEEASAALKRVIAAKEETLPPEHEDLYYRLFRLAHATFEAGQLDEALIWSRRFMNFLAPLEPEHLLRTKRRVALILAKQTKFSESAELYHETLAASRDLLGEEHWLVSTCMTESARVYRAMEGQHQSALDLERQMDLVRNLMDRDTMEGLQMLVKLADVHLDQHRYHEACAMYEESFEALQTFEIGCLGEDGFDPMNHFVLKLNLLSSMADAHAALSKYDTALQSHRMVLEIIDVGPIAGREDERDIKALRVSTLGRIAKVHEDAGRFYESLNAYRDVLEVEERTYGPGSMES